MPPTHARTGEPVSRAEAVLFVDCGRNGNPGEFYCEDVCPQSPPVAFTDHLSPAALLDLWSELYGSCPKAYLVSIGGESFETGGALSPAVEQGLPELKARLHHLSTDALAGSMAAH